jgi:hypothetical protein
MNRIVVVGVTLVLTLAAGGCAAPSSPGSSEESRPDDETGGSVAAGADADERPAVPASRRVEDPVGCAACGPLPDPWRVAGPLPDPWHAAPPPPPTSGGKSASDGPP